MVMARGRHAGNSEAELLQTLLEACGQCEEVPEAHVDIHTGLSGSGVAFVSVAWSPHSHRPAISQVPVAAPTLGAQWLGPRIPVSSASPCSWQTLGSGLGPGLYTGGWCSGPCS